MKSTKQIEIKTTASHLWKVLTESSYTKQYMFNCSVESDWKLGSSVIWEGEYNGYKAYQQGEVIKVVAGQQLTYSTFDPNQGLADVSENYIHVSYTIHTINDECQLTITNETFDNNPERMSHINQGWDMVIGSIKSVAEEVAVEVS